MTVEPTNVGGDQGTKETADLTVHATSIVRKRTGAGRETIMATAATLGVVIDRLNGIYPGFRAAVSDSSGQLDKHFRVYSGTGTRLRDLDTPVGNCTELRLDYF